MAFIEIQNITKSFRSDKGVRHILENVNLSVEEGEIVSVVGYTGSGKSTFISIVAGLLRADSGQIRLRGAVSSGFPSGASIVFQNYSLLPWFSAMENVRLAVDANFPSWSRERQREQAARYLEMVGLGNSFDKRPNQLSGGMRQRVAIARAFAIEPEILFMDEPFGALDALTRANLQQELAKMCSAAGKQVTMIMITNSVQEAILLSDRIVPMTRGPRATLGPAISVALERPRTASQLLHDEKAVHIQSRVVEFLTGFTHGAPPAQDGKPSAGPISKIRSAEVEA